MKTSGLLYCLLIGVSAAHAQKGPGKVPFRLLTATQQTTRPATADEQAKTTYHFLIVWENTQHPESFFWRGDRGWLTCNVEKAHKTKIKSKYAPGFSGYRTEFVTGDQMNKGDTLAITPVSGGKFRIPEEVPVDAKNTLYYKTGGSGWLSFPVKKIARKPAVLKQ